MNYQQKQPEYLPFRFDDFVAINGDTWTTDKRGNRVFDHQKLASLWNDWRA